MKKRIIFLCLIFLVIMGFIFTKFEYKNVVSGNNISEKDFTDILNISSYEATVSVEVYSNKNTNKYIIKQSYKEPRTFKQEILEPSNIKGVTIIYDGEKTILENKALNLKTLYENFGGEPSNLSLISFINEFKTSEEKRTEESEEEKIMEVKISKSRNKYQMYQKLYISKSTNLPTKMEILDENKNRTVYILYNEISLNDKREII